MVYNAKAAGSLAMSCNEMESRLEEVGFTVSCLAGGELNQLDASLLRSADLVIAAGGDGTVRELALRLYRHKVATPLTILPMGTCNNIARTLGIDTDLECAIAGLRRLRVSSYDLGLAAGPWRQQPFLEAFGFGLLAQGMHTHNPKEGKDLVRAVQVTFQTLANSQARLWQLELDGQDISGSYLLGEVMNTRWVGPKLRLAPDANPSDGRLDVVLISEDQRIGLATYLASLLAGEIDQLPNVTVLRGRRLRLEWDGSPLHFDEEVWPQPQGDGVAPGSTERRTPVTVEVVPKALELWLPWRSDSVEAAAPAFDPNPVQ